MTVTTPGKHRCSLFRDILLTKHLPRRRTRFVRHVIYTNAMIVALF